MSSSTEVKEATVGRHWMHARFAENLINASSGRDLKEAAQEWRLEKLGDSPRAKRCHLCNTQINHQVVLVNQVNNNHLVIGADCYDKLRQFLRQGKVASALPTRLNVEGELRRYWRCHLSDLPDRTVVGWLKEQLATGQLTPPISDIVYSITRLGFAPTRADADTVVEYYKATRLFPIELLIAESDLAVVRPFLAWPPEITINQVDEVLQGIEKMKRRIAKERQRLAEERAREEAARRERQEAEYRAARERDQRQRWEEEQQRLLRRLAHYQVQIAAASRSGIRPPLIAEAAESLERVKEGVEQFFSQITARSSPITPEDWENQRGWESQLNSWWQDYRWFLVRPELILFVPVEAQAAGRWQRDYVLVCRDGRWVKQSVSYLQVAQVADGSRPGPSLWMGRVRSDGLGLDVLLQRSVEQPEKVVTINFSKPSNRKDGGYVGTHHGKIVLPTKPFTFPTERTVFLMKEEGSYYQAWVI